MNEAPSLASPKGTIVVSYGMPKSASSFAWMLIKKIAQEGGLDVRDLSANAKGNKSAEDYLTDANEDRQRIIKDEVGDGTVVIKTHAGPKAFPNIEKHYEKAIIFAQHRDPREIALSLIDHAARSRRLGISDFAECTNVENCRPVIISAIDNFISWCKIPKTCAISYNELCFELEKTIPIISQSLNVTVDTEEIINHFKDKSKIIQFNKGQKDRWKNEMTEDDENFILEYCKEYYNYFK